MATDSFTNTNGVGLGSHAAGGNTWSGCGQAEPAGEIQNNTACADASDYFSVSARATNSSADFSQIVFKGGTYDDGVKRVHVRASGSTPGYWISASISGGNIVGFALWNHESFLTTASITPVSQATDQTVAIKATTNGSNVELRAWINGTPITWDDTQAGNGVPGTTYTNLAADSPGPILSGNPGFSCDFFGTISIANSAFDNWTDVEGGASAAVLSAATPSGTIGTQTTATIGATTDQSSGNFYVVVDSAANLVGVTATQIKSGQRASGAAAAAAGDAAVSTTSPSVGVTGLVANTAYAYAAVQNNANGDSNIVTGTFTTASATAASGTTPGRLSGRRIAILMQS